MVDINQFIRPVQGNETAATPAFDVSPFIKGGQGFDQPVPQPKRSLGQEFGAGIVSGSQQLVGSTVFGTLGLLAEAGGNEQMREWAMGRAENLMREAEFQAPTQLSFTDMKVGEDFFTWMAGSLGQGLPSLAAAFAGGGVGAIAARKAVENRLRKTLGEAVAKQVGMSGVDAARVVNDPRASEAIRAAMMRGGQAGAMAVTTPMMAGQVQLELDEAGIRAPGTAAAAGVIGGALGAAPVVHLMGKLFPAGVDKRMAQSFTRDAMKTMGLQTLVEGSTEAAQEAVVIAARAFEDPTFDFSSAENRDRIVDAAAIGALMGIVSGGAGVTGRRIQLARQERIVKEEQERQLRRLQTVQTDMTERLRNVVTERGDPAAAERAKADSLFPTPTEISQAIAGMFGARFEQNTKSLRDEVAESVRKVQEGIGATTGDFTLFENSLNDYESAIGARVEETLRAQGPELVDTAMGRIMQAAEADPELAARLADPETREATIREAVTQALSDEVAAVMEPIRLQGIEAFEIALGRRTTEVNPDVAPEAAQDNIDVAPEVDEGPAPNVTSRRIEVDPEINNPTRAPAREADMEGTPDQLFGEDAVAEQARQVQDQDIDPTEFQSEFDDRGDIGVRSLEDTTRLIIGRNETGARDNLPTVPYATQADAEAALPRLMRRYNAPESAFEVVPFADVAAEIGQPRRPGFAVRIIGETSEGGLGDSIRVNRAVDDARRAARQNPDPSRRIEVTGLAESGKTRLDAPTLAAAGRRHLIREGIMEEGALPLAAELLEGLSYQLGEMALGGIEGTSYRFEDGQVRGLPPGIILRDGATPITLRTAAASRREAQTQRVRDENKQKRLERKERAKRERNRNPDAPRRPRDREEERARRMDREDDTRARTPVAEQGRGTDTRPADTTRSARIRRQDRMAEDQVDRRMFDDTEATQLARSLASAFRRQISGRESQYEAWMRTSRGKVQSFVAMRNAKLQQQLGELGQALYSVTGLEMPMFMFDGSLFDTNTLMRLPQDVRTRMEVAVAEDPIGRVIATDVGFFIYISPRLQGEGARSIRNRQNLFAVLAHEIGHVVEMTYLDKAPAELQQRLRRAHQEAASNKDFGEWMADQFVAWASRSGDVRSGRTTRTVVGAEVVSQIPGADGFFSRVAKRLTAIYDAIRGKYPLNETYAEFMDGIAGAARGRKVNELAAHFIDNGIVGHQFFATPREANFEIPGQQVGRAAAGRIRRNLDRMSKNTTVQAIWKSMRTMHDVFIASQNGAMRRMPYRAATQLAEIFNRTPGEQTQTTYFNRVQIQTARFAQQVRHAMRGIDDTTKHSIVKQLVELQSLSAKERRDFVTKLSNTKNRSPRQQATLDTLRAFQEMRRYGVEAGLPINQVEGYFPLMFDFEKLAEADLTELSRDLANRTGMSDWQALRIVESVMDPDKRVHIGEGVYDPKIFNGVPRADFLKARNDLMQSEAFQPYRVTEFGPVMERYVSSIVKRAEFNRALGDNANIPGKKIEEWNPYRRLDELIADARKEGASEPEVRKMRTFAEAMLGRLGRDSVPAEARAVMGAVLLYQNMRLLLFATVSSFPDIVNPIVRANSMKTVFNAYRNNMTDVVRMSSDTQLTDMAKSWGIIQDAINNHIFTEQFDNHWLPGSMRDFNEKFFRYTGLEYWTNFTRKAALAVGDQFIQDQAAAAKNGDQGAIANLLELGLSIDDVNQWVQEGKNVFGSVTYPPQASSHARKRDQRIAEALTSFVNEAVMRPDPSQRPGWASHPAAMLVFHLKSFMYSFHNTMLRRMGHNFREGRGMGQKAFALMPALMLMGVAAAGLELRELIQYRIWGRTPPSDRQNGWEYTLNLYERAGLFGMGQLAADYSSAESFGKSGLVGLMGPTIQQIGDAFSSPNVNTALQAVPVLSQMPGARAEIREALR